MHFNPENESSMILWNIDIQPLYYTGNSPENHELHLHDHENLISHILFSVFPVSSSNLIIQQKSIISKTEIYHIIPAWIFFLVQTWQDEPENLMQLSIAFSSETTSEMILNCGIISSRCGSTVLEPRLLAMLWKHYTSVQCKYNQLYEGYINYTIKLFTL